MAHEPKLEVYKIYLRPTPTTSDKTFGSFLNKKHPGVSPAKGYKALFQDMITSLDTDFIVNDFSKKGLSLDDTNPSTAAKSLTLKSSDHIISGKIKGGRFGQKRSIGDIKRPKKVHTSLSVNNIVLDTFYFLLYTPLGSNKGVLIIQSYSEDQINDVSISWLKSVFKTDGFYQPHFESYCPVRIQREFKERSAVKELKFTNDVLVSDIDSSQTISNESVTVTITIRAKNEGEKLSKLAEFRKLVGKIRFGNKKNPMTLDEFKVQTGLLYNGSHQSSFELGGALDIKPTIYLRDKIRLQPDGTPEWESLDKFCLELLDEIKPEVYPENHEIS